jgi:hypothetical protein
MIILNYKPEDEEVQKDPRQDGKMISAEVREGQRA